jgi:diacylglycerol kinase family enzyme
LNPATPCVIFNPSARGEKAARFLSHPDILGGQCVLLATSAAGHARQLAAQAARNGFHTIIAAGGDGTANEVLNGIADVPGALASVRLGLLPLGTVNVFARELGLPLRPRRAWEVLQRGAERIIDLGWAEFSAAGGRQRRCFLQLAGAGLDSRAIELTEWNVKKKIGPLAYLCAGLKALLQSRPTLTVQATPIEPGSSRFPIPLAPQSGERARERGSFNPPAQLGAESAGNDLRQPPEDDNSLAPQSGERARERGSFNPSPAPSSCRPIQPAAFSGQWVALGNGRFYGGPFPLFPNARMDDGLLDVCVIPKVSLARSPAILAGFLTGSLSLYCGAARLAVPSVTLTSPSRVLLQLDGENVGRLPATLWVQPKSLRVIVP